MNGIIIIGTQAPKYCKLTNVKRVLLCAAVAKNDLETSFLVGVAFLCYIIY